ncbi:MAG: hypothetical protein WKF71_15230 [Pyrinomonadaceae bacterium]
MSHPKVLDKDKTALVVVDLQEAFRHPINEFALIAARDFNYGSRFSGAQFAHHYYRTISERFGQNS